MRPAVYSERILRNGIAFCIEERALHVYLIILFSALVSVAYRGARVVVSLAALAEGASPLLLGVIAAATVAAPTLLAVRAGKTADRHGPRMPMVLGSIGLAAALALPAIWPGIPVLFAAVVVLGLSQIFFHVTVHYAIGLFGDRDTRTRNFSTFALAASIAAFIGPAGAGFGVDHAGFRVTFAALAAIALIPGAVILVAPGVLPQPKSHARPEDAHDGTALFADGPLRRIFIASGMVLTGIELFTFYVPIYGRSIGLSATAIGIVLAAQAVAAFVVRLALPSVSRRLGAERMLALALVAAGATYLLFPLFRDVALLTAIAFALGLALGCGQPLSIILVYDHAPSGRAGEALGMRLTVNKLTQFGVPLVFGSLASAFGLYPVFWANAVLLAGSGALALRRGGVSSVRSPVSAETE
jgi:MFS family permease